VAGAGAPPRPQVPGAAPLDNGGSSGLHSKSGPDDTGTAPRKSARESIYTIKSSAASLVGARHEPGQDCIIVYEFKLEGMTCVNCSSAIENGMKIEFKDKGLVLESEKDDQYSVSVILLMHKMKISFNKKIARQH